MATSKALSLTAYLIFLALSFIQVGASLFATSVNVSTLIKEPPRSLFMMQGDYAFNPDIFWSTFPPVTLIVFIAALVINWKTVHRKWLLAGWLAWLIAGLIAIFLLGPVQETFLLTPYADAFDPELQALGKSWYSYSILFLSFSVLQGIILIVGLVYEQKKSFAL